MGRAASNYLLFFYIFSYFAFQIYIFFQENTSIKLFKTLIMGVIIGIIISFICYIIATLFMAEGLERIINYFTSKIFFPGKFFWVPFRLFGWLFGVIMGLSIFFISKLLRVMTFCPNMEQEK